MSDTLTATLRVASPSAARGANRTFVDIGEVPIAQWRELFARAIEPNAFYHPAWARAASEHAREAAHAKALLAYDPDDPARLIGLMPVVSSWQALGLPLPLLVSWQPYTRLTTPLIDRTRAHVAAAGLIDAARAAGARALLHIDYSCEGAAAMVMRDVLAKRGLAPRVLRRRERACLDATQDADALLHEALGAKKLKELRRQRHRLEDLGEVKFEVATAPADVARGLDQFLALEASGWKGMRGTALAGDIGDLAFIRAATQALAQEGCCEIVTLTAAGKAVAAGIVLRHDTRAYFFKIAYDEELAKSSPGVQLTLDLTRRFCADGAIADVDSTANAYHPMIDKIWRERLAVATAIVPLRANAFVGPMQFLVNARERVRRDLRRFYHRLLDSRETPR